MVAIHFEHKLDAGILTIARINSEIDPGESTPVDMIQFRFECGATGAWFDADMDRRKLTKLCNILGEDEELSETMGEPPSIASSDQNTITATFMATGKKRKYPVIIFLTKRTHVNDIVELCTENDEMRSHIGELNECIVKKDQYIRDLLNHIRKLKEHYNCINQSDPPQYEPRKVEITQEVKIIFDMINGHNVLTHWTGDIWTNMIIDRILAEECKVGINNIRNENNHSLLYVVRLKCEEYRNLWERVPRAQYFGDMNDEKRREYNILMQDWGAIETKLVRLGCK